MKKATVTCVSGKAKSKLKMGKKKKKGTAPHLQLHFTLLKSPKVHWNFSHSGISKFFFPLSSSVCLPYIFRQFIFLRRSFACNENTILVLYVKFREEQRRCLSNCDKWCNKWNPADTSWCSREHILWCFECLGVKGHTIRALLVSCDLMLHNIWKVCFFFLSFNSKSYHSEIYVKLNFKLLFSPFRRESFR